MPSKGVKCYTYIGVPGVEIELSVPRSSITKRNEDKFTVDQLEVDKKNLAGFKMSGKFEFKVRRDGRELTTQWVDVNSLTGKLENGTMKELGQTPSVFAEDLIISYGLYDAGNGKAGLPNQHQCYITVTRNYENWQRDIAPPGSDQANRPFNRMVLPSAHDIGMNSMEVPDQLFRQVASGALKLVLGREMPGAFSFINDVADGTFKVIGPDIIRALAITQKDSLDTILKLGARYFEFRPAKCHRRLMEFNPVEDTIYFQHGAIPGMSYKQFLTDTVQFLSDHRDEIVVVQNRWDGVPGDCPRASDDELRDILNDVLRDKDIQAGNEDDMRNRSIQDLRNDRKRLIITQNVNQVSNYDDAASATLDGEPILRKILDMAENPPRDHPIIFIQCQATATNIRDVVVVSALTADTSNSPLLATKAICDRKILPALRDVGKKLGQESGVLVILNDFFDGATADVAIQLCRERLG